MDPDKRLIDQLKFRITEWMPKTPGINDDDPTPNAILLATWRIQDGKVPGLMRWDEDTERKRRTGNSEKQELEIQTVEFPGWITPPSDKFFPHPNPHDSSEFDGKRKTKLTEKAVIEIFRAKQIYRVLAEKHSVSITTIMSIKRRRIWRELTEGLSNE